MNVVALAYLGASIVAVIGGIVAFVRWAHPAIKAHMARERAKDLAILGGPIIDPLTSEKIGEQPSLGVWIVQTSKQMADTNANLAAANKTLKKLTDIVSNQIHETLADHAQQLKERAENEAVLRRDVNDLMKARDERTALHLESAYMLKLAGEGDPDLQPPRKVDAEQIDEDDDK